MNEQLIHHYPAELMALLINCIPRLIRGKRDVLAFFKGCGVTPALYADIQAIVLQDRQSINKFDIVRRVLDRINDKGDTTLARRREILRRVTQWDDFSGCYDNDRMEAKGYVSEIAKLVNVKDSFTRMNLERENVERESRRTRDAEIAERQRSRTERNEIKSELFALFGETNASTRGTALERVLNRLFKSEKILIRAAFKRVGTAGEGVVEQIDGAVELDGRVYLVEMKWWSEPLGVPEVSSHFVRLYNRDGVSGIVISNSGYTDPAVSLARDTLAKRVCVYAHLSEIVFLLESETSLSVLLKKKIHAAIVDKNPLLETHSVSGAGIAEHRA